MQDFFIRLSPFMYLIPPILLVRFCLFLFCLSISGLHKCYRRLRSRIQPGQVKGLTFTPAANLESPTPSMALDCGGGWSTRRKSTQPWGEEHANSTKTVPSRPVDLNPGPPCCEETVLTKKRTGKRCVLGIFIGRIITHPDGTLKRLQ